MTRKTGRLRHLALSATALIFAASLTAATVNAFANSALDHDDNGYDYMKIHNLTGPSGVALGATGAGYYEINPEGKVSRTCVNNIHMNFVNDPRGMIVGAYDGNTAVRLQRDNGNDYGMRGYADSYYTGLWPRVELEFENSYGGAAAMGFSAFSGVVAQDVKNSSLPVVFYEVTLKNTQSTPKEMSALLSWGDIIGRGLRDTNNPNPSSLDGESSDWYEMDKPQTYAKGVSLTSEGGKTYTGVMQYAKSRILPEKATFQNYNDSFMLLAEGGADSVTVLKNFNVNDSGAFNGYVAGGKLSQYSEEEVALSGASTGNSRGTTNGSAVAVTASVPANGEKKVRFALSWFMTEISEDELANMLRVEGCDYNKYYHKYFFDIEEMTKYAIDERDNIYAGVMEWQNPLLSDSTMPDWLKFKQINSGYTLYTNGVLNKRGNFSTLEGLMGGYGGTMDQKMSSHPFYEKLFPELNLMENRQFANVTGSDGEIQHFDVHYYHGMSSEDPAYSHVNPVPAGSMTDNSGAWMVQMWNYYRQTGDKRWLQEYYEVMKTSMGFIQSKCADGVNIPNYNTTYDDYQHPPVLIYSGTVYLNMLDIAEEWARLMGENDRADAYAAQYALTYADVEKLYGNALSETEIYGDYFAFGSDYEYITSNKKSGSVRSEVMFSGAMAGQFMSRYSGLGDVVAFDKFVSHMKTFIMSSVQKSNDYFAPKVYNLRTDQDMDNSGSRCWPFYLDSYGGMAAIQAGYLEDGLEILQHTMLVELRQGYMWSQNLWNPANATYMTAPVSWFIGEVLAGSAIDVPGGSITLGPVCPSADALGGVGKGNSLNVTLYYPKFWAQVDYRPDEDKFDYKIIKTFYGEGENEIRFNNVIAAPTGNAYDRNTVIELETPFVVREGATLDLSAHLSKFAATVHEKNLQPVNKYVTPQPEKVADGAGLLGIVEAGGETTEYIADNINYRFNSDNLPAEGVEGEYKLTLKGRILPRYGQKYQLIFEYTGNMPKITFAGREVTDYSEDFDDIESQQFNPTPGCKLVIITRELKAGAFYTINIEYDGDVSDTGDDVLRFLWWSTTQQMGLVITERMYQPMTAFSWMNGLDYSESDTQPEGDHVAYTQKNTYALYNDVDFGTEPMRRMSFRIKAAAPANDVSAGGTMDILLGGKDGKKIGTLDFKPTGDWNNYTPFTVDIVLDEPVSGVNDVCLKFNPRSTFLFNYTEFGFVRGYDDEKYPTKITFEKNQVTAYLTDGFYLNPVTVDEGKLVEALRYTTSDAEIATVRDDGTVVFHTCGTVTVTAKSLEISESYVLTVTMPSCHEYDSDFDSGEDGWQFGTGGKQYDKAQIETVNGRKVVVLDGSDLGSRDHVRNSWIYRAFNLENGYIYSLSVNYVSPADAATNIRVVIKCQGMPDLAADWKLTENVSRNITLDLSDYAGKLFYVYIEQDDHSQGIGEVVHVTGVALYSQKISEPVTYSVTGKTLAGVSVSIYTAGGELIESVTADGEGNYSFKVGAGDYIVRFEKEDGAFAAHRVTVDGDVEINEEFGSDGGGLSGGAIAGICVGCAAALAGAGAAAAILIKRRKSGKAE